MTIVRFTDGRAVDVIDADCEFRPCFRFGFDKGSFTPGVGYTSYYSKERPVCFTRHLQGCPHVGAHLCCHECGATLGVVLEDEARIEPDACPKCGSTRFYWFLDVLPAPQTCCENPVVPKPRGSELPFKQRCKSCGAMLRDKRLEMARASAPGDSSE